MNRSSYNFFLVSLPFLTLTVFFFLFYFFLFNSISNKAAGAATQAEAFNGAETMHS